MRGERRIDPNRKRHGVGVLDYRELYAQKLKDDYKAKIDAYKRGLEDGVQEK